MVCGWLKFCDSAVQRIGSTIEEKIKQAVKNRNHIINLYEEMFGKSFSDALNIVIAIPEATVEHFEDFMKTEKYRSYGCSGLSYKISFIEKDNVSGISSIFSGKSNKASGVGQKVFDTRSRLMQFYATITLVKTSFKPFHPNKFCQKRKREK